MQLWSIITPKGDNHGNSYANAHQAFQHDLVEMFDGFTAGEVCGGWLDNDSRRVYYEHGIEYRVLSDVEPALVSLAAKHFPDQLAFCMARIGEGEIYCAAKAFLELSRGTV